MKTSIFSGLIISGALLGLLVACGDDSDSAGGGEKDAGSDASVAECPSRLTALIQKPTTSCQSYQTASAGMCAGYYCGLTEEQLTPMIPDGGACAGDPAFTCEGRLVNVVGACARKIKTMAFASNPQATNCELRPMIEKCVNEDAEIAEKVTATCLGCFLDAAECAGDNCLVECLSGDSPDCDTCRLRHNCEQPVFSCGGLPNPFSM